jgi:hypothetical protein
MTHLFNFKSLSLVAISIISIAVSAIQPANAEVTDASVILTILSPYLNSTNGVTDLGIRPYLPLPDHFRIRAGVSLKAVDGAVTYSLDDFRSTFNPFIGVGFGVKSIKPVTIGGDTSASSFFGTAGVDFRLNSALSITGAVVLPTNSAYGTEFQVGVNFNTFDELFK